MAYSLKSHPSNYELRFLQAYRDKRQRNWRIFIPISHKERGLVADRGYSTAPGVHHVASKKAYVMVRVNTKSLLIQNIKGDQFPLLKNVMEISKAGTVRSWKVQVPGAKASI